MTPSLNEVLRSGIEAARTNQFEIARTYLNQVLDRSPDNITAMFWLAYVASSPQKSIEILKQVMILEPDNERAQAGIRWAKQRMNAASGKNSKPLEQTQSGSAELNESETTSPDEFVREQIFSPADARKRAKKSALAHRARRTIDPLLAVVIIIGAVILLTVGVWALLFGPPATLAAWFPVPIQDLPSDSTTTAISSLSEQPTAVIQDEAASLSSYASVADTIIIKLPQAVEKQILITEAEPLNLSSVPDSALSKEDSTEFDIEEDVSLNPPIDFIGPAEQILDGPRLYEPVDEALLAYQPASSDEKWIEVDVTKQRVTAWEGNVPVMSFNTSTGLPNTPTVLGHYNIYWKLKSTLMTGPGYYLPEVPYTMYFYSGYALHGAYWHNNFGQPMSHGCVNLSPDNAKELFDWAQPIMPAGQSQVVASADNPGTLVVVHD